MSHSPNFAYKGPSSQTYGFPSSWVSELDHKEGWSRANWCFQTVVLEKTLENSLDNEEIKQVNPKGNQPWIFIERTDAEAPILWPPDAKSRLIGKGPGAGKDWGQEEKGVTEDEMAGQHHWLIGHEFEQALGDGEGQGSLACCSPWGHKESDTTKRLIKNNKFPPPQALVFSSEDRENTERIGPYPFWGSNQILFRLRGSLILSRFSINGWDTVCCSHKSEHEVKWQMVSHSRHLTEGLVDPAWPSQPSPSCLAQLQPRGQRASPSLTVQSAWPWPGAAAGAPSSSGNCPEPARGRRATGSRALPSRRASSARFEWPLEGSDPGGRESPSDAEGPAVDPRSWRATPHTPAPTLSHSHTIVADTW